MGRTRGQPEKLVCARSVRRAAPVQHRARLISLQFERADLVGERLDGLLFLVVAKKQRRENSAATEE